MKLKILIHQNILKKIASIPYFTKIKADISKYYQKIKNLPDIIGIFSDEIESIITISEKLEINTDELEKLRKEKDMLNQASPDFDFKLVECNEGELNNIPEKIIFIMKASNQKISYENFIQKLIDDLKYIAS